MRLHNSDQDGNVYLSPAQARGLHRWLGERIEDGSVDDNGFDPPAEYRALGWSGWSGGVFLNYDHDVKVLVVDAGADPDAIRIDGGEHVYGDPRFEGGADE